MPTGQFPGFLAGQVLTAALMNEATPLFAYKSGDTSRTTTTTVTADPDLSVSVAASAFYMWLMMLDYEGGTQGSSDLKFEMAVPAGATCRFWMGNVSTGGAATTSFMGSENTAYSAGTGGAASLRGLLAVGSLLVSTTPGTFQLQWAQNTSNGTATIVHAKSCLALLRFA